MNKFIFLSSLMVTLPLLSSAQYAWQEGEDASKLSLTKNLRYNIEMQGSFSDGKTPLWLNANKHGLSSLEQNNGYLRAGIVRPLETDSARRWGIGYGVDLVGAVHYTSKVVVQQAYVEARWLHGVLSIGSKEYPMELKNQTLSSGSQTLGINARPVPQVRLALPKYWTLPILGGWLQLKGHIAYGKMTDEKWQSEFTHRKSNYAEGVLYHSKAGYLRIGNENYFCPWSLEMGLEMATIFGGTTYCKVGDKMVTYQGEGGLRALWNAFFPGGADAGENVYVNKAGDQLGSWVMRLNYDADSWRLGVYADHFFEDDSQMFLLDYNGYGEGKDWNKRTKRRYFMYALKDIMLGTELNIKYGRWLRNVVVEYLYTKYQSGPYNHDRTANIPDHLSGTDDYYNHSRYPGWQHWGQVIGNPFYRSPIYNSDGQLKVMDNRFVAWHLGFDGQPSDRLGYRVLLSYQKGWGTYADPFTRMHHNMSLLVEGNYRLPHGWGVKAGYGMDSGSNQMLGNNRGFQITISKRGNIK